MGNARLVLVAIAAVLLVGCGSGPATTEPGKAANLDQKFGAAKKPDGTGAPQTSAATAQLGPGAVDADNRVGSKAGGK